VEKLGAEDSFDRAEVAILAVLGTPESIRDLQAYGNEHLVIIAS
jgi:hypothetical protein